MYSLVVGGLDGGQLGTVNKLSEPSVFELILDVCVVRVSFVFFDILPKGGEACPS